MISIFQTVALLLFLVRMRLQGSIAWMMFICSYHVCEAPTLRNELWQAIELLFSVPQFREVCVFRLKCISLMWLNHPTSCSTDFDFCTHNFGPGSIHGHQVNDATRRDATGRCPWQVLDDIRVPGLCSEDAVVVSKLATVVLNLRLNGFYNSLNEKQN